MRCHLRELPPEAPLHALTQVVWALLLTAGHSQWPRPQAQTTFILKRKEAPVRCISPSRNYSIQVFPGVEKVVQDRQGFATRIVDSEPVIANFEGTGLLDWEIGPALESFNFSGLPEGVNPLTRISVFDTEAYVASRADIEDNEEAQRELLDRIDTRLRKLQARFPSEFVIVEKPAAVKPWPTYDTDSVEDILAIQARLGMSAEGIRIYEVENQARPEVIEAMEAIENGGGAQEEVILSA